VSELDIVPKYAKTRDREAFGKAMRASVPRSAHAKWQVEHARAVAIERIQQSLQGRIPSLISLRNQRMAASPFAYFRGGASVMSADLLHVPPTRLFVQLCGDAHVCNFGTFARFDGSIGFDVNDFDETYNGPFEWDLKRLAASIVLAGRESKHADSSCGEAVRSCVSTYRLLMKELANLSPFEVLRRRANREEHARIIESLVTKARHKTPARLLEDLTEARGDARMFKDAPPLLARVGIGELPRFAEAIETYTKTLPPETRAILQAWRLVDVAFKVVGVGSVGLACYVALLATGDNQYYSILQFKEVRESTVEVAIRAAELPVYPWAHQGQRVIEGQRAMQTHDDPFVGYTSLGSMQLMVRRLAENKAAIDNASAQGDALASYAEATGSVLALSHAVTGDPVAIAAYLGNSDAFERAMSQFAVAYADQANDDFAEFTRNIAHTENTTGVDA